MQKNELADKEGLWLLSSCCISVLCPASTSSGVCTPCKEFSWVLSLVCFTAFTRIIEVNGIDNSNRIKIQQMKLAQSNIPDLSYNSLNTLLYLEIL